MSAEIVHIDYVLPEKVITNDDLAERFDDFDAKKVEKNTGVHTRHVVSDGQTALDLAVEACNKLFEKYDKANIDFLVLCTQTPEYYLPASSCILQDRLQLSNSIGALDINLGCSGYVYGLGVSKSMIDSGMAQNVLFVTMEAITKFIHPGDKANLILFGDAASATVVSGSSTEKIHKFVFGTDGSGYKSIIVENGGCKNRIDPNAPEIIENGNVTTYNNVSLNGMEVFNFTIDRVPGLINDCLQKNQFTLEDIDMFIFHQANKYMLDFLRRKIKIPEDKFYLDMRVSGNTSSNTIPIALTECLNNKTLQKGSKVLIAGFGVGLSWGATVLEI